MQRKKSSRQIFETGNPSRLSKEQLSTRQAEENTPLPTSQQDELRKIDELISTAMRECSRGGGKNVWFTRLLTLTKARKVICETKRPPVPGEPDEVEQYLGRKADNYFEQLDDNENS